jgi:hypothetical protein
MFLYTLANLVVTTCWSLVEVVSGGHASEDCPRNCRNADILENGANCTVPTMLEGGKLGQAGVVSWAATGEQRENRVSDGEVDQVV